MASSLCDHHDPGPVADYKFTRWAQDGQDDGQSLSPCNRAHWSSLQSLVDLWKFDIPLSQRSIYTDAEGLLT